MADRGRIDFPAVGRCWVAGMKRLMNKLQTIPHLFAKIMVLWCVGCGTAACAWSLRIMSHTGHEPAALLGVILAFFGGELLLMCLKTVLSEKRGKDDYNDND